MKIIGSRLTNKQSKKLYIALTMLDNFENVLTEKEQEILECLAMGITFAEIAKPRGVTMQAIQNSRIIAINKLGFSLHKNGMSIQDLYKDLVPPKG